MGIQRPKTGDLSQIGGDPRDRPGHRVCRGIGGRTHRRSVEIVERDRITLIGIERRGETRDRVPATGHHLIREIDLGGEPPVGHTELDHSRSHRGIGGIAEHLGASRPQIGKRHPGGSREDRPLPGGGSGEGGGGQAERPRGSPCRQDQRIIRIGHLRCHRRDGGAEA